MTRASPKSPLPPRWILSPPTSPKRLKKKDGKVTLVGFGTFMKVRRKARKGRNPQTGEVIKIKAANVVKFKPGKKLRDAV
jgi:DNA-binding protein HU-beta